MASNSQSSAPVRSSLGAVYANLLDPSSTTTSTSTASPASISRAPVVFKPDNTGEQQQDDTSLRKQQVNSAALRFQPTKRPQLPTQKPKPKASFPKSVPSSANNNASNQISSSTTPAVSGPIRPPVKSTLADWTGGDDDVNGFYGGEKRQRGGRKRRKKNKEETAVPQNWDDIYDPSRPNSYEEYKNSDEKIREVREWKDRLYAHRMAPRRSSDVESEDERLGMNRQFAPPPNYSFAPPPSFENEGPSTSLPPPSTADIPNDPTGEDAYMRRMQISQAQQEQPINQQPPSHEWQPHPSSVSYLPPPPPNPVPPQQQPPPPPPPPPPPSDPTATISRAPVRYNLPPAPAEIPASEAELEAAFQEESSQPEQSMTEDQDQPRSLRPGQKGFAERLMSKYGWTKGSGLGASGTGIINPLRVQVEKQKRKADSEGGGTIGPGGRGKIIGGKKQKGNDTEEGIFGRMSEVVVMKGMVDGMDLDAEMNTGDLIQEIGEECSEKYGRVERVYIHRTHTPENSADVYVKFTSQLSALRAVNALQDRIFNGNPISARFFDGEKFEAGEF